MKQPSTEAGRVLLASLRQPYPIPPAQPSDLILAIEAEAAQAERERYRAVVEAARAWFAYWDARTVLWDAVGKCGHDPMGDCPEMDAIREQGTDDKVDHALRAALQALDSQPDDVA